MYAQYCLYYPLSWLPKLGFFPYVGKFWGAIFIRKGRRKRSYCLCFKNHRLPLLVIFVLYFIVTPETISLSCKNSYSAAFMSLY